MKIALASCEELPGWEVDDKPLIAELESKGAIVETPAWTDDIDWGQFNATIIRTTWDYHLNISEFLKWTKRVPRLYNNAAIVFWNSHKSYLKEMESKGATLAPTRWIQQGERCDIKQALNIFGVQQGFLKPQVGACASDTFRFDETQFTEAQDFLNKRSDIDMMLQPYIASVETIGELTAIFFNGEFSHGVQKIPVPGDYRVQDDFGATDMPYEFTPQEIKRMEEMLAMVPENEQLLYARFDFLKNNNGELLLNELELIEPSLFFRHSEKSPTLFANAIFDTVSQQV